MLVAMFCHSLYDEPLARSILRDVAKTKKSGMPYTLPWVMEDIVTMARDRKNKLIACNCCEVAGHMTSDCPGRGTSAGSLTIPRMHHYVRQTVAMVARSHMADVLTLQVVMSRSKSMLPFASVSNAIRTRRRAGIADEVHSCYDSMLAMLFSQCPTNNMRSPGAFHSVWCTGTAMSTVQPNTRWCLTFILCHEIIQMTFCLRCEPLVCVSSILLHIPSLRLKKTQQSGTHRQCLRQYGIVY